MYLTSDDFSPNPWDNLTNYWDTLVKEVYDPPVEAPPCPNPANPQMTLMVPLFSAGSTGVCDWHRLREQSNNHCSMEDNQAN